MKSATQERTTEYNGDISNGTSIIERIIEPQRGGFSTEHAGYGLSLNFSAEEQARYAQLAGKVQENALTEQEDAELNEFLAANALLTVLQSKARISLKKHNPAA
jgi:hypothetical protein